MRSGMMRWRAPPSSVNALDLDALGAGALDARAHRDQEPGEVAHLGLSRGVLEHRRPLGEDRRHHQVLGAGHRDEVVGDPRALEPARPRLDVAVLDRDVGAELGEALQVLVDRPHADRAAPGQGHARHAAARQQRAEHEDGRAHGGDELVRRLVARELGHPHRRCRPGPRRISAPRPSRSERVVTTSASSGTFSRTTGSAVSSVAHSAGSAAFFAALTSTCPRSGTPPSMTSRVAIGSCSHRGRRRPPPREISVAAGQVAPDLDPGEPVCGHRRTEGGGLLRRDLHHQPSPGPQHPRPRPR